MKVLTVDTATIVATAAVVDENKLICETIVNFQKKHSEKLMPAITGTDNRKKNDTIQTYYDTERQEFRCFKKANLMSIA